MIKKDEILKLMKIYQKEYDQYTDCIMFEDFDSIAESLVKLCNKHIVSNNEMAVCNHDSITYTKIHETVYKQCLKCRELLGAK